MGRNSASFLQRYQACEMGIALWVNRALDQNLAMYNADYGERVKSMYRYIFEWGKRSRESFFFLRQLKTSTKWFKGEGNCTVPLSALFLRNLFLPANRTVSVGHIGRPVLSQKYTVHSEVESLKTTLPWNPNVVLWVVFLLSTWWVADLTYATSSLSNID